MKGMFMIPITRPAVITDDQYDVLLRNYLLWCEDLERYEECEEINKTIKKLKQWIEKS
jgi:hypothetical protein